MEDLFRLMLVRPAVAQDPNNPSVELSQETPYQQALRQAIADGRGRTGAEEASAAYVASADFVGTPAGSPLAAKIAVLSASLDQLEQNSQVKPKDLTDAIKAAFNNQTPADIVASQPYKDNVKRLRDSLMAIKVLQQEHSRPIEELAKHLRTLEVIAKAAADSKFPVSANALRRWRRRSAKLPVELGLGSRLSTKDAEAELRRRRQEAIDARKAQVTALIAKHEDLRLAIADLGSLESKHFRVTAQTGSGGVTPPDVLRFTNVLSDHNRYTVDVRNHQLRTPIIELENGQHAKSEERLENEPLEHEGAEDGLKDSVEVAAEPPAFGDEPFAKLSDTLVRTQPTIAPGMPPYVTVDLSDVGFILHPTAETAITERTRRVLTERNVALTAAPLDRITEGLRLELSTTVKDLEQLAGHPTKHSLVRIGDNLISVETPITTGWGVQGTGGFIDPELFPMDGRVPRTKGEVAPAGVADLLVVRQQLLGYEAVDVAHIENVLKGERKLREHTRVDETEVITLNETEVTKSEEHELESTDRFEMTRETAETIKEDISLKAGLSISGKYGPTVEFTASAEGAFSRTKEEASKAASTFSQDVTERSSKKVAERVLQRTTTRILTQTTEKNTHELNNVNGNSNISGVYQWVNKLYRAQMFNYGLRAMFDFMVPEPSSFIAEAMRKAHTAAITLKKPPAFDLLPTDLDEAKAAYWTHVTGATDVAPPPEEYRTKSADFKAGGGEKGTDYNHSGQISIDDGYRAIFGSVGIVRNIWEDDNTVEVVVGRRTHRARSGDRLWTTTLDDEQDSIPFAIDTFHCSQVAVAIEIKTQRTKRAMDKWQYETHAKLLTAHQQQVADYEEKLNQLRLQAGIVIRGKNPAANQETVKDEMKKNCISILTDQHFDLFDSINDSPTNGLPEIDVFEAAGEGPYVRFFEQAFEWEHMTWVTYPYFWGRKDGWDEAIAFEDPDPAFQAFLQAGFARVSVPARPGFEGAIDHFLTFGETWNGGPLPTVSSPLYLPIADEIAERLDRPGTEVAQGDPWQVRVPTSLVILRSDGRLPDFEDNDNDNGNGAGNEIEA